MTETKTLSYDRAECFEYSYYSQSSEFVELSAYSACSKDNLYSFTIE